MPLFFVFLFLFIFCLAAYTTGVALLTLPARPIFRKIIIALGFFSPISFILANVWFRYYPNIFSQVFYTFSSYLGGLFIYWFLASIFLGVFYVFFKFKKTLPLAKIASFFYIIFSLIALIGIVQAFFIEVTSYEVKVGKNGYGLSGKKIVLVADTHFGPVTQERFGRRVVNKILAEKPDLVLIAGDMFDGPDFDKLQLQKEMGILAAKVPVFFVPGNHENYGDYQGFLKSAELMGMKVLVDSESNIFNTKILGIGYRQNKSDDRTKNLIQKSISKDQPTIVMIHEPSYQKELIENGAFLVVFAHTHNGQFWPGNFFAQRVYKEYTYGKVQKENTTFITTKGVGTAGPRFRTFNSPEIVVINLVD